MPSSRPPHRSAQSSALPGQAATTVAWPLVTASQMHALDRYTIDQLGIPSDVLMESAGRAVAEVVLEFWQRLGGQVVVVCGRGNNGGDGLVAARHLVALQVPVRVVVLDADAGLTADTARNLERARAVGLAIESEGWRAPRPSVVVDAIFGTGLRRKPEGTAAASIRRMAAARSKGCAVVAIDLPSGLDADTGQELGRCVAADCTVTIGLPKCGLALEPGRTRCGAVRVARIGIADSAPDVSLAAAQWTRRSAAAALPRRPRAGHKGSFGHVLMVAGSEGKTGAAALASIAAGRAGAGLVTLACPASLNDVLEQKCTEAMTAPVAETAQRSLAAGAQTAILALAAERDVVALGPGIGREDDTGKLVVALAQAIDCPLVIDADGLAPFASNPDPLRTRRAATILTPHPGEAARLLGTTSASINADRIASARTLASCFQSVVALKGAATVIAQPGGRVVVNPTGGPELATGGTGDVLTGIVAALVAQGLDAFTATAAAVYLHGLAGERVAKELGTSGLLAGDVASALPATLMALRQWQGGAVGAEADEPAHRGRGGPASGLLVPFPDA